MAKFVSLPQAGGVGAVAFEPSKVAVMQDTDGGCQLILTTRGSPVYNIAISAAEAAKLLGGTWMAAGDIHFSPDHIISIESPATGGLAYNLQGKLRVTQPNTTLEQFNDALVQARAKRAAATSPEAAKR